jgi:hypothetical protein
MTKKIENFPEPNELISQIEHTNTTKCGPMDFSPILSGRIAAIKGVLKFLKRNKKTTSLTMETTLLLHTKV